MGSQLSEPFIISFSSDTKLARRDGEHAGY